MEHDYSLPRRSATTTPLRQNNLVMELGNRHKTEGFSAAGLRKSAEMQLPPEVPDLGRSRGTPRYGFSVLPVFWSKPVSDGRLDFERGNTTVCEGLRITEGGVTWDLRHAGYAPIADF